MLKTPISYYGGKLNMLKHILPLIPEHRIYTEPFFGGGAVFFAKQPAESEIINDTNGLAVNFFEVAKTDFDWLKAQVAGTAFARDSYSEAWLVYRKPSLGDKRKRAWAFYVAVNMGFTCQPGSWGYDKYSKRAVSFRNRTMSFDESIPKRLATTQIENNDACKVIKSRDADDAFHYVDPPYIDSYQGHYGGYNEIHFKTLLETLSNIKGKFLLSSYPSELLEEFTRKNGWYTIRFDKPLSAGKAKDCKKRKRKTEVLTANYPIEIDNQNV